MHDFFNGESSVTSQREDTTITVVQRYQSASGCNVSSLNYCAIELCNAITKKTIQIFYSHFCLILCASFKERQGFTKTQAVKPWLKIY